MRWPRYRNANDGSSKNTQSRFRVYRFLHAVKEDSFEDQSVNEQTETIRSKICCSAAQSFPKPSRPPDAIATR